MDGFLRNRSYRFLLASLLVGLTSCAVGPNFKSPAAPAISTYTQNPLPAKTASTPSLGKAGKSQTLIMGRDIPDEWWQLFHSEAINTLVRIGIANSPNLAAAMATLREAQETYNAQFESAFFPAISGTFAGQRQRFPGASLDVPSSIFSTFNATVNVSYTLDVFGGLRRQVEGYLAEVDYQRYEFLAAYLTLTTNVVTTAVTMASLEAQIATTHELINAQRNQLAIVKKQFYLGGVSGENVASQETLLAQTEATLPPLEKSLAQTNHALAVLIGDYPNASLPTIKLNKLTLPTPLPVSLPSQLVRQRPDIMAAEALLHAANAQIGVATANLLPQITLTSNGGWSATRLSQLILPNNRTWGIGASILQPIFQGGSLWATRRATIAARNAAVAQYRQTVLQALQNVADSLRAIDYDAKQLRANRKAEMAAYRYLNLTQAQYRLGGASYLDLLNAQQQYLQNKITRITAEATRYNDTAALFQALGGGWWNKDKVAIAAKKRCKAVCKQTWSAHS